MRSFSKFLMQAFVCLLVANAVFAETPKVGANTLSANQISEKLVEAKQLLETQSFSNSTVSLTAFDLDKSEIHLVSLDKDSFQTRGGKFSLVSQLGAKLQMEIVRPNGVNTAVNITDVATGRSLFPLMVRFPLKSGTETAFYASAHPSLISADLAAAGKSYLTTMLNQAAQSLSQSGVNISPDVIAVASHLVIVEHTDHRRFLNDDRQIYPEILSLYALNQGDTFRYSVSSAGAGGMIQMIPRTYEAIRQHHPKVSLEPDFVIGLQNHANALKAMLLYINDTWDYLGQTPEVQQALISNMATKTELLAAGYNSNPYRLPNYLSKGGSAWRTLIPAETQMYLAIYQSVDSNIDFDKQDAATSNVAVSTNQPSTSLTAAATSALMSWLRRQALSNARALSHLIP